MTTGISAQDLPEIEVGPVKLSEGIEDGFAMDIPGADFDMFVKGWNNFIYTYFPPVQSAKDQLVFPTTLVSNPGINLYMTTGIYLPSLSQNPINMYFLLKDMSNEEDGISVSPSTRIFFVVDFGNSRFLNVDNINQVAIVKHFLNRFYVRFRQTLANKNN